MNSIKILAISTIIAGATLLITGFTVTSPVAAQMTGDNATMSGNMTGGNATGVNTTGSISSSGGSGSSSDQQAGDPSDGGG